MNNTQLYLSIGIPSFLVILAWLSNRADIQRMGDRIDKGLDSVRSEMSDLRREMQADISKGLDRVRAEMIAFRRGMHAEMIAFRREIHADMIPLHERVAVVEARVGKK